LNLIASFFFDVSFGEGRRIDENIQGDFRLSSKIALLSDAPGQTNLKPGRFHKGIFSSVSAGTILATGLPWRMMRTVSPFSTRVKISDALFRNSVKDKLFIYSRLLERDCTLLFIDVQSTDSPAARRLHG
jgi:hypothetical protein